MRRRVNSLETRGILILLAFCVRASADDTSRAYLEAVRSGDHAAAYRAQSFLVPPYGDDPNSWHGIVVRRAINGRIGHPSYPFTYEDMTNLKLRALYDRAGVAAMEKAARSELDLVRAIADWANRQWGHMRPLPYATWDALEILDRSDQGDAFWCEYKAALFVQTCNSAGLTARIVGINRKDADSHMVAEVYSNQFRKWILVDAWWNCYYERAGIPLSAREFHAAAGQLAGIDAVFGPSGKKLEYWDNRTGRTPAPQHANGRVVVATDELKGLNDWYYDIRLVMRNDHTAHPQQHANQYVDGFMVPTNFRAGDWRGSELHWVDASTPPQLTAANTDDVADFEWPLNEVKVDLRLTSVFGAPPVLAATLATNTPSFLRYDLQIDGRPVELAGDQWTWHLHPGLNRLRVQTVNAVGRAGFPSEFELEYDPSVERASPRAAVALPNPDWETAAAETSNTSPAPAGWSTITSNALGAGEFALDRTHPRTGRFALRVTPAHDAKTGVDYAFIVRSADFRVNPASDVIYSVWLKSDHDGTPVDLALVDGTYKGHGTYVETVRVGRQWQRYELKCRLHSQLTTVWVGFKVYHGTVWADDADVVEVKP